MSKFVRITVPAFLGVGDTPGEADDDMKRRADKWHDALEDDERVTDDPGIQILMDADPGGGGGPCITMQLEVARVLLDADVLTRSKPSDDD